MGRVGCGCAGAGGVWLWVCLWLRIHPRNAQPPPPQSVPVTFIYGQHDWMNPAAAQELAVELDRVRPRSVSLGLRACAGRAVLVGLLAAGNIALQSPSRAASAHSPPPTPLHTPRSRQTTPSRSSPTPATTFSLSSPRRSTRRCCGCWRRGSRGVARSEGAVAPGQVRVAEGSRPVLNCAPSLSGRNLVRLCVFHTSKTISIPQYCRRRSIL